MAGKPFNKQLAADLIKDIKNAVSGGRKAGPLGNLELKISTWTSKKDNLLNTLHQEVSWTSNQSDAAPYAIDGEAHALRFAASASAGVNNWNPAEGNIDVGVKGSAAFSLAEASVSMNSFFPNQGGYVATMAYRNALKKEVLHPMGVFRMFIPRSTVKATNITNFNKTNPMEDTLCLILSTVQVVEQS